MLSVFSFICCPAVGEIGKVSGLLSASANVSKQCLSLVCWRCNGVEVTRGVQGRAAVFLGMSSEATEGEAGG